MGVSENSGFSPQIIHFNRVFHYFNHPIWGTPVFGNTHINLVGPQFSQAIWSHAGNIATEPLGEAAAEMKRLEKIGRMWITFLATVRDVIKGFEMLLWKQMRSGTSCKSCNPRFVLPFVLPFRLGLSGL